MSGNKLKSMADGYIEAAKNFEKKGEYQNAAEQYKTASELLVKSARFTKIDAIKDVRKELAEKCFLKYKQLENARPPQLEDRSISDDTETIDDNISDLILSEKPNILWTDIGGLEKAKMRIKEAVILPMGGKLPPFIKPWKGVLLFGPPGTGKTLLAKAVATEADATFFNVSGADMLSKFFGESSKIIKRLFKSAKKHSPSIIFVDEIDALAPSREGDISEPMRRTLNQLLQEIDGLSSGEKNPFFLTATNTPWNVDTALLSRLEKRIYIPITDLKSREAIFNIKLKDAELDKSVNLNDLAEMAEGYSGRDIDQICREAGYVMLRENEYKTWRPISMNDFNKAFNNVKPSVPSETIKRFDDWNEQYGSL